MDKQKRTSIEKQIENTFFRLKLGTVNRTNPEVVYLEGKTFIVPVDEERDYSNTLKIIRKGFSNIINNRLFNNPYFKSNFILDLQVANSGIELEKKSFLTYQLLLRQNNDKAIELKKLKNLAFDFFSGVTNELSDFIISNGFALTKTKKEPVEVF